MTRDPSDGSVKEPKVKPDLPNSGLAKPEEEKPNELLRLNKSREWLKDWHSNRVKLHHQGDTGG